MKRYSIGEIAARAGVTVDTVRFYERKGLLPEPPRTAAGYRRYPAETVDRLLFVQRGKALGFTLEEVGGLLDLHLTTGEPHSPDVRRQAAIKVEEIDRKLRDLTEMRNHLQALVDACDPSRDPDACVILESLSGMRRSGDPRNGEKGHPPMETPEEGGNMSTSHHETSHAAVRTIEVFTAGCPCCDDALDLVQGIACPSCRVEARDMRDPQVQERARELGIRSVPAVAVNGVLADCCAGRGPNEEALRAAGVGAGPT